MNMHCKKRKLQETLQWRLTPSLLERISLQFLVMNLKIFCVLLGGLILHLSASASAIVIPNPSFDPSSTPRYYYWIEFHESSEDAQLACKALLTDWGYSTNYCTISTVIVPGLEGRSKWGSAYFWDKRLGNNPDAFYSLAFYYDVDCPAPYNPACNVACGSPFTLSADKTACNAYCKSDEPWDPLNERCIPPPETQSCETQGNNPIDFIQGRKYRSEKIIQSGIRHPFSLTYFYNNQRNQERTPTGGRMAVVTGDRYLAATKPPMTASEYQVSFNNLGVPAGSTFYKSTQHYGGMDQYWRHNFDEVLQIHGSQYVFQTAKGYEISFTGFGASVAYPHIHLQALAAGEESFAGYKLTDNKNREVKKFNGDGQLMKIERSPLDVLTLTYDTQNRLDRITNSEGAFIQLTYQSLTTDSVYSVTTTNRPYPISVTNNRGESAQITWGSSYQGKAAKFHLITQITEATTGPAQSARTFEYNDARYPASITDQYFVADIGNSANKQQTLHFDYDDLGRAVFSGLAGVRQSDSVNYVDDNIRVVTNALGKRATYHFADFNGVKRLQSVTGEPTQNCVSSEAIYEYDANGNVSRKIQNGQVTEYTYDGLNREITRMEAAGLPYARKTETEYHPTLNLPIQIIQNEKITHNEYDITGNLIRRDSINLQN